jgi:ketosteroid isomerase-like protein
MRLKGKAAALEVFAIIDAMDAAALAALFTDDATLVFGNAEPFVGPEQIRSGTQEFPDTASSGDHQSLRVAVLPVPAELA